MPTRAPYALATAVSTLALLLAGCGGSPKSTTTPTPTPTPMSELNTAAMNLPRADFCAAVPETAVRAALGGAGGSATDWQDGDRADLGNGLQDVAHEFGCSWRASQATAAAWMFAPAVNRREAREFLRAGRKAKGCTSARVDFGSPGYHQECESNGVRRVRYAGLFSDTWFTCELRAKLDEDRTAEAVDESAEQWCVQVVGALNTTS